jgi:hypothetical protein
VQPIAASNSCSWSKIDLKYDTLYEFATSSCSVCLQVSICVYKTSIASQSEDRPAQYVSEGIPKHTASQRALIYKTTDHFGYRPLRKKENPQDFRTRSTVFENIRKYLPFPWFKNSEDRPLRICNMIRARESCLGIVSVPESWIANIEIFVARLASVRWVLRRIFLQAIVGCYHLECHVRAFLPPFQKWLGYLMRYLAQQIAAPYAWKSGRLTVRYVRRYEYG